MRGEALYRKEFKPYPSVYHRLIRNLHHKILKQDRSVWYKQLKINLTKVVEPVLDQHEIGAQRMFNGNLYAGTGYGGKLLRRNGSHWDIVAETPPNLPPNPRVIDLCVFNNELFGIINATQALFKFTGSAWIEVAPKIYTQDSYGTYFSMISLCVFKNKLYGVDNAAMLCEWNGVNAWIRRASQLCSFQGALTLFIYNDKLHCNTTVGSNQTYKAEIFQWSETSYWIPIASHPTLSLTFDYNLKGCLAYGKFYGIIEGCLLEWDGLSSILVKIALPTGLVWSVINHKDTLFFVGDDWGTPHGYGLYTYKDGVIDFVVSNIDISDKDKINFFTQMFSDGESLFLGSYDYTDSEEGTGLYELIESESYLRRVNL